jgi:hypothetical protein
MVLQGPRMTTTANKQPHSEMQPLSITIVKLMTKVFDEKEKMQKALPNGSHKQKKRMHPKTNSGTQAASKIPSH